MSLGLPTVCHLVYQWSTKWQPELMQALTSLTVEFDGINPLISALNTVSFILTNTANDIPNDAV